jgi:long-chain acyl-CoA synthetase
MTVNTVPHRLMAHGRERGHRLAYFERINARWIPTTYAQYADQVRTAARALLSLELKHGERICVLGFNRPEWVIADVAAMCVGAAPAGIYTTCSPEEVQYIANHAEAAIVVVEDHSQWAKIAAMREQLPHLRRVILMKGAEPVDDPLVWTWDEFIASGTADYESEFNNRMAALQGADVATLIYTSGTTGPPKAVMLTHANLSFVADAGVAMIGMCADDSSVSYLPLSHIAEQMITIHGAITAGAKIYFAESMEKLPDNLKEVQPTIVFGVPRVWEKIYDKVAAKLKEATGAKRKLVDFAMSAGFEYHTAINDGRTPPLAVRARYALAHRLIYRKLKPLLGLGNVRLCVSGAAPISREVIEFFMGLDIMLHEIYGQSEDCGPTTFNFQGRTRVGTVGVPIPGVEVKIAEDGEICVRGPNVFKGYLKDEAATQATMRDGWLLSGDLGEFDADGFLSITGRKKDIIITAGGKNIAPKNLEAALTNHPLISQAVVIGDRRRFLSALVTLEPEGAAAWADTKGLATADLPTNEALLAEIQGWVDNMNSKFARVEHIRKFTVLPREFNIDSGELTPTMKIKRAAISRLYETEIEAIYAKDSA